MKEMELIETIRIENGVPVLLPLHIERMRASCRELFGSAPPSLPMSALVPPPALRNGRVKCRIVYGTEVGRVEFMRYEPCAVRSLRLVSAGVVDYHLKYADRSCLELLRAARGGADEVLIIRDGLVTDTSFSNIVCRAGHRLLTPARPLLKGVMRRFLLESGMAEEAEITPGMLLPGNSAGITEIILVNAMRPELCGGVRPEDIQSEL